MYYRILADTSSTGSLDLVVMVLRMVKIELECRSLSQLDVACCCLHILIYMKEASPTCICVCLHVMMIALTGFPVLPIVPGFPFSPVGPSMPCKIKNTLKTPLE